MVLVNTKKGQQLFDAVKEEMNIIPAELGNCLQHNLQQPSVIHSKRIQFENEYKKRGFEYVFYKYGEEGWRYKVYSFFGKFKRLIKRIIGGK